MHFYINEYLQTLYIYRFQFLCTPYLGPRSAETATPSGFRESPKFNYELPLKLRASVKPK